MPEDETTQESLEQLKQLTLKTDRACEAREMVLIAHALLPDKPLDEAVRELSWLIEAGLTGLRERF